MKLNRDWVEHPHGEVDFRVLRGVRGEEEGVLEMAGLIPYGYLVFDYIAQTKQYRTERARRGLRYVVHVFTKDWA